MKTRNVIIGTAVIVIAVVVLLVLRMSSGVSLYKDEHTTGNTSGNLLNGGLFCEVDDTIYFANPANGGTLYSMNEDLGKMKQVFADNASYINAAGKYLFYTKRNDKKPVDKDALFSFSSTGLYRMKRGTRGVTMLYRDPTQVACLYGNYVYYQHYIQKTGQLQLYKTKIDGSDEKMLLDEACAPTAVDNDRIYYTSMGSDHGIHVISTEGGNHSVLYAGNCTGLSKQGNYLYFIDMEENYTLKRISIDGGEPETLVSEGVLTYNVSPNEDVLYYQPLDAKSDAGIYAMDLGSRAATLIVSGNFNYLHLTKNYLFFEELNSDTKKYDKIYAMNLATRSVNELELPTGK